MTDYDYLEIRDDIADKIATLEDFARYEGTEVGESVSGLCAMWRYAPDYISDEMYRALVDEIRLRYEMVENDYDLIEKNDTITIKTYEYKH